MTVAQIEKGKAFLVQTAEAVNFNLTHPAVIQVSQHVDTLIVKQMKSKKAAPREHEAGKSYRSFYWNQNYKVLAVHDVPYSVIPWSSWAVTIQWEDGTVVTHATRLEANDKEIMDFSTAGINAKLEIVKLGHQIFKGAEGCFRPTGYAFKHPDLGYFAFEGDCPYRPAGGRETLQSILDAGGFLDFDTAVWIKAIE